MASASGSGSGSDDTKKFTDLYQSFIEQGDNPLAASIKIGRLVYHDMIRRDFESNGYNDVPYDPEEDQDKEKKGFFSRAPGGSTSTYNRDEAQAASTSSSGSWYTESVSTCTDYDTEQEQKDDDSSAYVNGKNGSDLETFSSSTSCYSDSTGSTVIDLGLQEDPLNRIKMLFQRAPEKKVDKNLEPKLPNSFDAPGNSTLTSSLFNKYNN